MFRSQLLGNDVAAVNPDDYALGRYPLAEGITPGDFDKLFGTTSSGRPYNVFVMFNTLDPSQKCTICK